ncbi:hypothetical protein ACFL3D_02050 [Candidatus Omnitrophota bacterium]
MKKTIIIWGGNGKPLSLENIDSHASVSAFYLTKYLSKYFNVINLTNMDKPEDILKYNNIYAVISTFQKGFTNRIVKKNKKELFYKIRDHIKGKLCSIYDYNDNSEYHEDLIFTVRDVCERNIQVARGKSFNSRMTFHHIGWCADPNACCPTLLNEKEINIFIDHPPYSTKVPNATYQYYDACKKFKKSNPLLKVTVYQQTNSGIKVFDLESNEKKEKDVYIRTNKVPWIDMMQLYKKIHFFCITHPESACLSAIEAAMCGAVLCIPLYRFNRPFIPRELLAHNLKHELFRYHFGNVCKLFQKHHNAGFSRIQNHKNLSLTNSWDIAAQRIYESLNK